MMDLISDDHKDKRLKIDLLYITTLISTPLFNKLVMLSVQIQKQGFNKQLIS